MIIKPIIWTIAIILALGLLNQLCLLLFSNPYTGTITFFTFFAAGGWALYKTLKDM